MVLNIVKRINDVLQNTLCLYLSKSDLSYSAFKHVWQEENISSIHRLHTKTKLDRVTLLQIVFDVILRLFYNPCEALANLIEFDDLNTQEVAWNIAVLYCLYTAYITQHDNEYVRIHIGPSVLRVLVSISQDLRNIDEYGKVPLHLYRDMWDRHSFLHCAYSGPTSLYYSRLSYLNRPTAGFQDELHINNPVVENNTSSSSSDGGRSSNANNDRASVLVLLRQRYTAVSAEDASHTAAAGSATGATGADTGTQTAAIRGRRATTGNGDNSSHSSSSTSNENNAMLLEITPQPSLIPATQQQPVSSNCDIRSSSNRATLQTHLQSTVTAPAATLTESAAPPSMLEELTRTLSQRRDQRANSLRQQQEMQASIALAKKEKARLRLLARLEKSDRLLQQQAAAVREVGTSRTTRQSRSQGMQRPDSTVAEGARVRTRRETASIERQDDIATVAGLTEDSATSTVSPSIQQQGASRPATPATRRTRSSVWDETTTASHSKVLAISTGALPQTRRGPALQPSERSRSGTAVGQSGTRSSTAARGTRSSTQRSREGDEEDAAVAEFEALVGLRPAPVLVRSIGTRRSGPRPPPPSLPALPRGRAAVTSTTTPTGSRRGRKAAAESQSPELSGATSGAALDADTGDIFDILSRLEAETTGVLSGAQTGAGPAQHPNTTTAHQLPSTEHSRSRSSARINKRNAGATIQSCAESLPVHISSALKNASLLAAVGRRSSRPATATRKKSPVSKGTNSRRAATSGRASTQQSAAVLPADSDVLSLLQQLEQDTAAILGEEAVQRTATAGTALKLSSSTNGSGRTASRPRRRLRTNTSMPGNDSEAPPSKRPRQRQQDMAVAAICPVRITTESDSNMTTALDAGVLAMLQDLETSSALVLGADCEGEGSAGGTENPASSTGNTIRQGRYRKPRTASVEPVPSSQQATTRRARSRTTPAATTEASPPTNTQGREVLNTSQIQQQQGSEAVADDLMAMLASLEEQSAAVLNPI